MKYHAQLIANPESEFRGKYAACHKEKGNFVFYLHNIRETMEEAQEQCLIAELQDLQAKMDKISNKLVKDYNFSYDLHAEKSIPNLLA